MTILVPCSGNGSRFTEAGYLTPKPFLQIRGLPMIWHVINNIATSEDRVILLVRGDHLQYLEYWKSCFPKNMDVIIVDKKTEGAACTVLLAENHIHTDEPMIIANSDQYVFYDKQKWLETCCKSEGAIMTFNSSDPKWSYAQADEDGNVIRVAEKQVISNTATIGVYYYAEAKYFFDGAKQMIEANDRFNEEFYVCPVYNYILKQHNPIKIFPVEKMLGLGVPREFEANKDLK